MNRGGLYEGPGGELLHGDGRQIESGTSWCCFCKQLDGYAHYENCIQHGGHDCVVGGDCRQAPGRKEKP